MERRMHSDPSMLKKPAKKVQLQLKKETLRMLTPIKDEDLQRVAGGRDCTCIRSNCHTE
jgi:hypothetical protein